MEVHGKRAALMRPTHVAVAAVLVLAGQTAALLVVGYRASAVPARRIAARMQMAPTTTKQTEVQSLMDANRALVESLAAIAPEMPEIARLRFALAFPDPSEAKANLRETVAWRKGAGRSIVDSAAGAVAKAMAP